MRGLGFETTGSCEGHLGRSFNYYPQVDIDTDPGPNDGISIFSYLWFLMNKILDARNRKKTREVPWIFISNGCYMTLKPEDVSLSLQKLQEEAKAFGIWLRCLSDKSIERIKGKAYLEYEEAEEEFYKESYDE